MITVAEVFSYANLVPAGPLSWGTHIPELRSGVYVIARVNHLDATADLCDLPLIDPLPQGISLEFQYEQQRWLPNEPVVYIGKTDRSLRERVGEFYRHHCGKPSPHAGGQIVKLLLCPLWIYWSPADNPYDSEQKMICDFKRQAQQPPFANEDGKRNRVRLSG